MKLLKFLFLWDGLISSPVWPQILHPLVSASQVLALQMCTTTSAYFLVWPVQYLEYTHTEIVTVLCLATPCTELTYSWLILKLTPSLSALLYSTLPPFPMLPGPSSPGLCQGSIPHQLQVAPKCHLLVRVLEASVTMGSPLSRSVFLLLI
jgi:hypothetical protein